MGLFNKGRVLADVIRCDEPDYLIWKWHPDGSSVKDKARENAIHWGSSLRVKDGSVAVFVYTQDDKSFQDYIVGPCDVLLMTDNLPILSDLIGLAYDGKSPFQAEVYFINLAKIIQSKFAVPYFDVFDTRFPDFGVPVAVRGTISYRINDYVEFIKLHRLDNFSPENFQAQIQGAVSRYVKTIFSDISVTYGIPVVQIETKIASVNNALEEGLSKHLFKHYGVSLSSIDISAIEVDKSSEGYDQLMAVTKSVVTAKVQAETEDYVERLRIQREENQYAMRKQTQTANTAAFQIEKQADVGIAGASALGRMESSGSFDSVLASGTGFNPALMMAGISVGSAVGKNIADVLNKSMPVGNNNTPVSSPPIPEIVYNVAVDGQSMGPYDLTTLSIMAQAGKINASTLVWKPGMLHWAALSTVQELSKIVASIPPEIK